MANSLTLTGIPKPPTHGPSIHVKRDMSDAEAKAIIDKAYSVEARDLTLPKHLFERQWFTNYLYLLGLQGMPKISVAGGRVTVQANPLPQWKRRYVANRILPMYARRVSQLNSSIINWEVRPKSPDFEDMQAAGVARSALFSTQETIGIDSSRWEMAGWQVLGGFGICKVEYDEWADGSKRIYVDPMSAEGPDGKRTPKDQWMPIPDDVLTPPLKDLLDKHRFYVEQPSGDIRVRPISPFELYCPILAMGSDLDSAPWLIHCRQYTMDQLYNRYDPAKVRMVSPDRDMGLSQWMQRRLKTVVAQYGYFSSVEDNLNDEQATVREMWIPPTRMRPEGRLIVASRNVILENKPHPLKDMRIRYPFAKADYTTMPDRFNSKGMLEDLVTPQAELNRTASIFHNIRDTMGQPKWWMESGNGIGPITSEPGQILRGKVGSKPPVPLQPQVDVQLHELLRAGLLDDMNTIAAQQDVTQAKVPPSVRSGAAIRMLMEKDDTVLAPAVRSLETALCRTATMVLRFMSKHYKDYRLISLHGRERAMDVLYFRGSDLRNNDRVFIKPGSLAPKSAAADAEVTLEMVQGGILNPALDRNDKRIVMRAMNYNYADDLFTSLMAHERRAGIENDLFFGSTIDQPLPEVRPRDDHEAHMQVHLREFAGDRYELAAPALQEAFDAHMSVHEQFLAAMLEQQMMMASAQKGAPGEKGEPSQPKNPNKEQAA